MGYSFNKETGLYILTPTLVDGGLNLWASATDLTHWTEVAEGTSTVNREATEKIEGDYSCRLDVNADNSLAQIDQGNIPLTLLKRYKLIFWYINSLAGKTFTLQFFNTGSNVWLKEDGTWNVGAYGITLPNSLIWIPYELPFYAHADYSSYLLLFKRLATTSSSIYFDKVSIEEEVLGNGKTLMVSSVIFVPVNADGDRLILADYNDNKFIEMKGLANRPNPIFFKKPRRLNGLKIATIDSGKAYLYVAKS